MAKRQSKTKNKPNFDEKVLTTTDVTKMCVNMCISSLVLPEEFGGTATRNLIRLITNPEISLAPADEIWRDIASLYETMFKESDAELKKKLEEADHFAIGIDRWNNGDSATFYAITFHFEGDIKDASIKYIFAGRPELYKFQKEPDLEEEFKRHGIDLSKCRAAVVNFKPGAYLRRFLDLCEFPVIRCFSAIIEEIICRSLPHMGQPDLMLETTKLIGQNHFIGSTVPCCDTMMIKDFDWVSVYSYMESFVEFAKVETFQCNEAEIKAHAKVFDYFLKKLSPLKIALDTLRKENNPIASLVQPLVRQLIDNFYEKKTAVDVDDEYSFITEHVRYELQKAFPSCDYTLLPTISYLDPRFHNLTDSNYLQEIKKYIKNMYINWYDAITSEESMEATSPVPSSEASASDISFFFSQPQKKKPRIRDPFDIEFENYSALEGVALDEQPQEWWQAHKNAFPRLERMASRFLCVPAMLPKTNLSLAKNIQIQNDRKKVPVGREMLVWLQSSGQFE